MDIVNAGFVGFMTIGFVNVVTMFLPNMDSRVKFAMSIAFAFLLTFVPETISNELLNHIKTAVEVAIAASGLYKIAQKAGGPTLPSGGSMTTTVVQPRSEEPQPVI